MGVVWCQNEFEWCHSLFFGDSCFFIMVFAGGFSLPMFIEKDLLPSYMNMWYMVENLICFPTSCW